MEKKKIPIGHNSLRSFFSRIRNNFHILRKLSGFTLVELLVVVGIIGILVTAVLLILNPIAQIQKSNDTKRKGDLAQIQRALETYYHDFGKYPQSDPTAFEIIYNGKTAAWGSNLFAPYMSALPKDSIKNRSYVYYSSPAGSPQSYWLYAALERTGDPQLCNSGAACASVASNGIPSTACGAGLVCNFGISSSNTSP